MLKSPTKLRSVKEYVKDVYCPPFCILDGIKVNAATIPSIRYADDTMLITNVYVGLQSIIENLHVQIIA